MFFLDPAQVKLRLAATSQFFGHEFPGITALQLPGLVIWYITMVKITIFNGKTQYFYGHVQ